MDNKEVTEQLANIVDKPVIAAAYVPEAECLMLCFPEGKTLYLSGKDFKIELEAAN